jgi:PAS domain S-box-containing protein
VNGRTVLSFQWGIGSWLVAIHNWIYAAFGFRFLLEKFHSSRNIYRKITFLNLAGAIALNVGPFISMMGWSPFRYFILSMVSFLFIAALSAGVAISVRTLRLLPLERLLSAFASRWKVLTPMARETVVQNMQSGMLVLDLDNKIVDLNPTGRRIIDAEDSRVVGERLTDVVTPEVFEADDKSFLESDVIEGEFRGVWAEGTDGNRYCFDIVLTPLGPEDDPSGRVALVNDVTERENRKERLKRRTQKLEQRTRELERQNEQLEEFAGIVSHDLRNPINVAHGHLDLLREADSEESIDEVEQSLNRMEAIIDDMLTLARQGQSIGDTESVSLESIALEAWEHVDTPHASLTITADRRFDADPDRLLNLFENLYRNAIEHVGPDVSVTVGQDESSFFVADDGPGIPEHKRDKILESGYTTAESGTGFGLAIVSQVAEAHGWTVTVDSADTGGAKFVFHDIDSMEVHSGQSVAS